MLPQCRGLHPMHRKQIWLSLFIYLFTFFLWTCFGSLSILIMMTAFCIQRKGVRFDFLPVSGRLIFLSCFCAVYVFTHISRTTKLQGWRNFSFSFFFLSYCNVRDKIVFFFNTPTRWEANRSIWGCGVVVCERPTGVWMKVWVSDVCWKESRSTQSTQTVKVK